MTAPTLKPGQIRKGWEPCRACHGEHCEACGGANVEYHRPPRWLELLAAITARTDMCGCWMPSKDGVFADIGGVLRKIKVAGSGDLSSLKSLRRRALIRPSDIWPGREHYYEPTTEGREALCDAMAEFVGIVSALVNACEAGS